MRNPDYITPENAERISGHSLQSLRLHARKGNIKTRRIKHLETGRRKVIHYYLYDVQKLTWPKFYEVAEMLGVHPATLHSHLENFNLKRYVIWFGKQRRFNPVLLSELAEWYQRGRPITQNFQYKPDVLEARLSKEMWYEELERLRKETGASGIPCNRCGGDVVEFSIPNDIWNRVIRGDGKERDDEYICIDCWFGALRGFIERLGRGMKTDE